MTSTLSTPEVLKADSRGRIRMPRERREELLDQFEQSGVSARRFSQLAGLKYQTFARWVFWRRKQRTSSGCSAPVPAKSVSSVRWLEAVVDKGPPSGGGSGALVVYLPGEARIEIVDARQAQLAAVLLGSLATKPSLSC